MPLTRETVVFLGVAVVDVALLGWLFVRVGKEEIAKEDLATEELRARTLSHYTQHLNEKPATGDTVTGRESSRSGLRPVRQENVTRAAQG
jgi:hypothetical protein